MSDIDLSKEQQILKLVKKILTDVAKETFTRPGLRHPLSDGTIQNMRDCLSLISMRESDLDELAGHVNTARPKYIDKPSASVVVPLKNISRKNTTKDE